MGSETRNTSRKIIIAILFPVVLFIIVCTIAAKISYRSNPFELERTWYLWIMFAFITAYLEDLIFFRSRKESKEEKQERTKKILK